MSTTSDWLAKLQAEPWYRAVQSTFAQKNIADPLWQSTLYIEDPSLDPTTSVMDHYKDGSPAGYSTGLFQLNANGLGAGVSQFDQTDPVANASIAAAAMAKRIAAEGTAGDPLAVQLQSIERAGWNGSTDQDAARQAALANVVAASGASTSTTDPNPGDNAAQRWIYEHVPGVAAVEDPVGTIARSSGATDWASTLASAANAIAAEAMIGAVFLALIAGGFAIAAQPER